MDCGAWRDRGGKNATSLSKNISVYSLMCAHIRTCSFTLTHMVWTAYKQSTAWLTR